ncbi:Hypothetical protein NTJ_04766 [Nesidiocoris tenuis]|uniref:Gustatory receptor n=1 Tax=Nesidiocoris tenuis TaxID=355587 RepID=A0ABN7AJ30_9HEMI|nr:Hypothetical protein NTJ_04766 [Nesidiocoris tenuis]
MEIKRMRFVEFYQIFPIATLLGLAPCSRNNKLNTFYAIYSVSLHVAYRLFNVLTLTQYIRYSRSASASDASVSIKMGDAMALLLMLLCVGKGACPALHVYNVIKNSDKFLAMISGYKRSDFKHNNYIRAAYVGLLIIPLPLILRQSTNLSKEAVAYAVCGVIDSLNVFNVAMQYCAIIDTVRRKFCCLNNILTAGQCKVASAVDKHNDLISAADNAHKLFENTLLLMSCYLGLDFIVAIFDVIESYSNQCPTIWPVCTSVHGTLCLFTVLLLCKACEDTKSKVNFYFHRTKIFERVPIDALDELFGSFEYPDP